jgi:glyoxylase-like metal-dependent hydrolase (beta-lactamase superfamily II)
MTWRRCVDVGAEDIAWIESIMAWSRRFEIALLRDRSWKGGQRLRSMLRRIVDLGRPASFDRAGVSLKPEIRYVVDTHVQADHKSGGRLLAEQSRAKYAMHRSAEVAFPFEPLDDGQTLDLGNVQMRVMHTPGHTPESKSVTVSRRSRQRWQP